MNWLVLVRLLGTLTCTAAIVACWFVARRSLSSLAQSRTISFGLGTLSAAALWKLSAFVGIVALPAATIAVANYHTFVGIHEVEACSRCHVMLPMVNDLHDPKSDTLAARHFKNGYIPTGQCYACHSDYGLSGDMAAKMEGYRHLARYTTRTYGEPIVNRTRFDNQQCLKCHQSKTAFEGVHVHHDIIERLRSSNVSCLNCHGGAHPTRADRTPGSPRYAALMSAPQFELSHE